MNKIKKKTLNLINWLSKYFKTDLSYLIKGEFWLMFGKIVNMIVSFLLVLAWANWIDKDIYGNYQYIFSLVGIISIFSLSAMGKAIIQAVARGFEGSFISGFKIKLKWGLLSSLAALIISCYYWIQGNNNFSLSFLIVAIFLPLFNASIVYTNFLIGRKLFNIQVKYDSITQVLATLIMILALFFTKKFLIDAPIHLILLLLISVYFTSRTTLRLLFLLKTKNKFNINKKIDAKTIPFGKRLTFIEAIDILASNLDRILLFHYLGAIELAIYSFTILVPNQINTFLKHIGDLALPKFSVHSVKGIKKTLIKKICYLAILISILVLIYILIAPYVYQIFFPKYLSSASYSRIYALSIIPLSFALIGEAFRAKMMTKQIYQIRIIIPIIRASLFIILIPLYGIWGAIIGILCARTCSAILSVFLFKKS